MSSTPSRSSEEILRARARALAAEPPADTGERTFEIIEFGLGDERYAIEMSVAAEIYPLEQLTPVPCTPAFVAGIVNVRGRMVAVIDIKKFFELPEKGITDLHRVIIVRRKDIELGLLADFVVGVRTIVPSALQPALVTHTGIRRDFLKGITADRLVVLDIERLLDDPQLVVNDEGRS